MLAVLQLQQVFILIRLRQWYWCQKKHIVVDLWGKKFIWTRGMRIRIRIRSDPVIFGPPDPDPTCNNGFIKLFLSWTKYKSELTNSSIKWWVIISNFIPTYLKYKKKIFFISISGRIRIRIRNFFSAEPDPDPWKKIPDPHPCFPCMQNLTLIV